MHCEGSKAFDKSVREIKTELTGLKFAGSGGRFPKLHESEVAVGRNGKGKKKERKKNRLEKQKQNRRAEEKDEKECTHQ